MSKGFLKKVILRCLDALNWVLPFKTLLLMPILATRIKLKRHDLIGRRMELRHRMTIQMLESAQGICTRRLTKKYTMQQRETFTKNWKAWAWDWYGETLD